MGHLNGVVGLHDLVRGSEGGGRAGEEHLLAEGFHRKICANKGDRIRNERQNEAAKISRFRDVA